MKTPIVVAAAVTAGFAYAALVTFGAGEARACAVAPPPGVEIEIADESALIVWDAASKTEHFIRQARFKTRGAPAADFGFLVPTPTKPELAEASAELFWYLEDAIKPKEVYEHRTKLRPGLFCLALGERSAKFARGDFAGATAAPAPIVDVLDEVRVAGYDAAILAATDAGALAEWLRTHGYDQRPALAAWLERYVAQGWIITAFKVTGQATAPVRVSFATERPFYPYREPADARAADAVAPPPRSLRVFFVGPERVQGTIGDSTAWPASVEYAEPLGRGVVLDLLGPNVPGAAIPAASTPWLQAFIDRSSPRPGTDEVFLAREATQATQVPPPVVHYIDDEVFVPLEPVPLVGLGAIFALRWRRRRAATKAAPQKGDA